MTTLQPRVTAGRPDGGQFAATFRPEGGTTLVAEPENNIARAEAFATLDSIDPGVTPAEFEDRLFDTWDTEAEFVAYTADPENELLMLGPDRTTIYDLPSGGVAAFYTD